MKIAKLIVENPRKVPWEVIVEPYAFVQKLKPNDSMTVTLIHSEEIPYFHLLEHEDITQIYCEMEEDYQIQINGVVLIPYRDEKLVIE